MGEWKTAPLILASAIDGDEWSTSRPRRCPRYGLNSRLGGLHSRCGSFGEDKS